ncbi:MAG: hypothetical protein WCY18_01735 [Methanofastidiosum sp.]|jgi:hypothetical protein
MEKKVLIMSIFAVLGMVGIALYQTNILANGFIAGFGYVLGVLSVIIGIIIGAISK